MIVSDVPTIISDSVKIIVFATKIFSDNLPGSDTQ